MFSRPISSETKNSTNNWNEVAMRHTINPVIANYYIDAFHETAPSSDPKNPTIWYRYVMWPHEYIAKAIVFIYTSTLQ